MRVSRGLLGWGVFFIVLGSVPLAVRSGALDAAVVRRAWELWPLILIGIGLGLVLERTRLAVAGSLLVAVTFGLMGGAALTAGVDAPIGITSCGLRDDDGGEPFAEQRGSFGGPARIELEMHCGTLEAVPVPGADWLVSGRSEDGLPPTIDRGGDRVAVRAPDRDGIGFLDEGSWWEVQLPRDVPTSLALSVNAGSADLDLAGMTVPDLRADVNAGDVEVDLSHATGTREVTASVNAGSLSITLPRPAGSLGGSLSVNAGSLNLCVPSGVALRLQVDDASLASNNFGDRGLVRSGDAWTTPGLSAATDRIELEVSANLGSITLDPEDGCD